MAASVGDLTLWGRIVPPAQGRRSPPSTRGRRRARPPDLSEVGSATFRENELAFCPGRPERRRGRTWSAAVRHGISGRRALDPRERYDAREEWLGVDLHINRSFVIRAPDTAPTGDRHRD